MISLLFLPVMAREYWCGADINCPYESPGAVANLYRGGALFCRRSGHALATFCVRSGYDRLSVLESLTGPRLVVHPL